MLQALRIRPCAPLLVLGVLAGPPAHPVAAASPPLDPAHQYRTQGEVAVTVTGPRCCSGARLTGRYDAVYEIDSIGGAMLRRLALALDDANVVVSDGFLGLFDQRVWIRCASIGLEGPAAGSVVSADRLNFPVDSVRVRGFSAESREPDGSCADPSLDFAGINTASVVVSHQPASDLAGIDAAFTVEIEGMSHTLHVVGTGRFTNRPPRAGIAFRYPDGGYPQEGCPGFWHWNGQFLEWVAEANDPGGLVGGLLSYAGDPDGSWSNADVLSEHWFDTRAGGERERLAHGHDVGPFLFEWGPAHRVELLALDHAGAADAASCSFRVVDTRPPTVQAPPPLVTGCTTPGGATAATSPALAAFLQAASATDLVDATPTALPAQRDGVDVTPTTLFPADGVARAVQFRFQDDWGNLGAANGSVTVKDLMPPTAAAAPTPAELLPTNLFVAIKIGLSGHDDCGGALTARLVGIASNAPQYDAKDIQGAAFGTDDRGFYLRARLAAPGVDRKYTIGYEVIDQAGNIGIAKTQVRVRAQ